MTHHRNDPATIDADGFCPAHGWDCEDFQIYLDESDEAHITRALAQ